MSHTATHASQSIDNFTHTHFGILIQLDRLAELPALLAPAELAKRTADQTLKFFKTGIFEHHAEEERALFPATIRSAKEGKERSTVESMVEVLEAQHRVLESLWRKIEPELKRVAEGGTHHLDKDALTQLVNHYKEHARMEEREFLPLAREILGRNQHHMAALGISLDMLHAPLMMGHI
jgi:hemerythrin-like domain-containing protein